MIYYYIYVIISLFCIVMENYIKTEKQKKGILLLAILPVFVLIAFKASSVGSDTPVYITMFEKHTSSSFVKGDEGRIEYGYVIFQRLLYYISHDPQIIFIATGLVVSLACYKFFLNNARNSCLALYFFMSLGFLGFSLSGIRQTLAISIILLSFQYIKEKKLYKFLLMVGLAMLFHKSAACFIPAYFIAHRRLGTKQVNLMFLGALFLFFFADKFLWGVEAILNYNYGLEETGNGYIFFGVILLITILVIRSRQRILSLLSSNETMININFLSLATWTVRLVSRTAERVSLYYLPFTAVALEEYISSDKKSRGIWTFVWLFVSTYLFLRRLSINEDLNNYMFYFLQ